MAIDLSVLICSTNTRADTFGRRIQQQVWSQYDALTEDQRSRIEILILTDNKQMMLGHKRNCMVDIAQGRYLQFIDDDDRIEPDMFASVLDAIQSGADVITFLVSVTLDGSRPKICRYSKDFAADRNTAAGYERLPNHICAVKRDLASKVSYPLVPYGEDSGYSKLLHRHLKTEHHIPRVLYHYDFSSQTTETQQHLRNTSKRRPGIKPLVDVVILSKATTAALKRTTQTAVDSCLSGANSLPLAVTVLEQARNVRYRHAATVHKPEPFNYNAFANFGASKGTAEWILVANNDLTFTDGWLHHLLAANHPLVSPKCPKDPRQQEFTDNTVGGITGKHLSGWCFLISRELWEQIGGFDEDVTFWCSDDALIEQVKTVGLQPMIVPKAVVHHAGSATLKSARNHDHLTWAQLDAFITKYGDHRLSNHPDYLKWRSNR